MKLLEIREKSVADLGIKSEWENFSVSAQSLTSLNGSPSKVLGYFNCDRNYITSLTGGPVYVGTHFSCAESYLISLKDGPEFVGGHYECSQNELTSLEGAPRQIGGSFSCRRNKLKTLQHAPSSIGISFDCSHNQLTSLKGVHRIIKEMNGVFRCYANPITEGLEYILLIKGVKEICSDDTAFDKVANQYLKNNPSGSIQAVFDVLEMIKGA